MPRSQTANSRDPASDPEPTGARTIEAHRFEDLTIGLQTALELGTSIEVVNELLAESLDAFGRLVPYDLAAIFELDGDELRVRVARGGLVADEVLRAKVLRHRLRLADFPSVRDAIASGRAVAFAEHDHKEGDGDPYDGVLDLPHGHHCMVVPLRTKSGALGAITFDRAVCGLYPPALVELAEVFGRLLAIAMSYGEQTAALTHLREQLTEQNRLLREQVEGPTSAGALLEGLRSPVMARVVEIARRVAATTTPVLITGETGTGKEVLARALHEWSPRAAHPLVSLNCATLPAGLVESELFGHVKGAFSGATAPRIGRFQTANGGTLFLDEVGELPLELQAKLLRVLQEGTFEPVGSDRTVKVDVRIIGASNLDLQQAVKERRFREDLYYRLGVFPIHLPPLRERPEDVVLLAERFLDALGKQSGRGPWRLGEPGRRLLESHSWPGNVRELLNVLERATILTRGPELDGELALGSSSSSSAASASGTIATAAHAAFAPGTAVGLAATSDEPGLTLEGLERRHIERTLTRTAGRIYGLGGAAELLGINPSTLRSRMEKLGLGGARDFKRKNAGA